MTKKDILKALDNASYISIISASMLVLIFEFTAVLFLLKLSIILFGASFLMLCVLCGLKLYLMRKEIKENDELLVDKAKESKPWIIVRLVLSAILFVLMVVFFCLY